MTRYVITRTQETVVELDDYDITDDEMPSVVAVEIALAVPEWETVHLEAMPEP